MGRFDQFATQPARGPADILRWKVLDAISGKNRKDPGGFVTPRREPDRAAIAAGESQLTWLGHASFLLTMAGKHILIDPVLAQRVGPVKRLTPPGLSLDELPPIDIVLLTHNHRDHLDEWTLRRLGARPQYFAPVGHAKLLKSLGADKVVELEWWQHAGHGPLSLTLVPARHWSMRFPWDRNDMLWGGWVIRGPEGTAYHAGDTALFGGFAEIGKRLGPIDWAMLPIGAYDPRWFMEPQHMNPEDALAAFRMLGAKNLVAMHWGTFRLTDEPVAEPPARMHAAFGSDDEKALWILDVGETRRLSPR